jgi:uncharacterized caspase-like protein
MAAMLKKLGFTVTLKKDARLQEMDEAVEAFGNSLKRGGVGLFYYAGHGVQVNGTNYLLPVGTRINKEADVKYQAVDANRILDEMANANNGLNIVMLDACRDNPYARSFRNAARGLAIVSSAPSGTFISYSTSPGNVARDGDGRNSPYTAALLQYIQTPGQTIGDIFINVRTKVKRETGQIPWELSSLEGQFYFNPQDSRQSSQSDEFARQKEALERDRQDLAREKQELERQKALDAEREQLSAERRKVEEERQQLAPGKSQSELTTVETGRNKVDNLLKGVQVNNLKLELKNKVGIPSRVTGVIIENIPDNSPAIGKLMKGDIIRQVNLTNIGTAKGYETVVSGIKANQKIMILLQRQNASIYVTLSPTASTVNETGSDGRFIAYDNGTVLDTKTNLIWAAKDNGRAINWTNARSYCENYRGGGYTDWRMPTKDELSGLHESSKKTRLGFQLTAHIDLTSACQWASDGRGLEASYCFPGFDLYSMQISGTIGNLTLPVRNVK